MESVCDLRLGGLHSLIKSISWDKRNQGSKRKLTMGCSLFNLHVICVIEIMSARHLHQRIAEHKNSAIGLPFFDSPWGDKPPQRKPIPNP